MTTQPGDGTQPAQWGQQPPQWGPNEQPAQWNSPPPPPQWDAQPQPPSWETQPAQPPSWGAQPAQPPSWETQPAQPPSWEAQPAQWTGPAQPLSAPPTSGGPYQPPTSGGTYQPYPPAPPAWGPAPQYGYPAAPYAQPPAAGQSTNTMAIVSLVCAFVCWPLAIVFGHIAKSQIKRTGEGGSGLATAGLAIGYAMLGLVLLFCGIGVIGAILEGSQST